MQGADPKDDGIDWRLATWEGATREQLRRWSELPLENVVRALEEMQKTAQAMGAPVAK